MRKTTKDVFETDEWAKKYQIIVREEGWSNFRFDAQAQREIKNIVSAHEKYDFQTVEDEIRKAAEKRAVEKEGRDKVLSEQRRQFLKNHHNSMKEWTPRQEDGKMREIGTLVDFSRKTDDSYMRVVKHIRYYE